MISTPTRMPTTLMGDPVFINDALVGIRPKRALPQKKWHARAGCYAMRVAKKWRKRFGMEQFDQVIKTQHGWFMSSRTLARLKQKLGDLQQIDLAAFRGGSP